MSSNDNTSTFQSYVDSAKGAAQNLYGSIVGSTGDEAAGKAKEQKGDAEYEASHATAKIGNLTASSSGAITKDHPDRSAGSWNQTVGSAKEFAGSVTGSESLKQSGREQNRSGQEQEARGQLSDLASGGADRVTGAIGGAVAGLTGNAGAQAEYQKQHDSGKTRERGAEHDITKQAAARE